MQSQPTTPPLGGGLPKYQYAPLPTPTSIRLLHVQPRSETAPSTVRCNVQLVDLNDSNNNIDFNALSYTWGNPVTVSETSCSDIMRSITAQNFADFGLVAIRPRRDLPVGMRGIALDDGDFVEFLNENPWIPHESVQWDILATRRIECDGQSLDVGESLYGMLEYLGFVKAQKEWNAECEVSERQERDLRKPVWIDAICINQGDLEERKAQVMLMSRIFRSAATVVGWLGRKDRLGKLFVKAALALCEFQAVAQPKPVASLRDVPGMTTSLWFSVFAWMQRLWFRRAWVAQEVVFAKRLVLFAGFNNGSSMSMPWETFAQTITFLHQTGLAQELNTLGQTLLARQPLQRDVRRLYQDDLVLEILGSRRANGNAAAPVLKTRPADAYAFVLSVQEMRERLGISVSNGRLVHDSQSPLNHPTELTAQGYLGSMTSYGATLTMQGPQLGEWSDRMSEKQKMIALIRYRAVTQKNKLAFGLVSSAGKGFIAEWHRPLRLLESLSAFRSCSSTDPRDKVYAFLGIATENLGIIPDYAVTAVDAFLATSKAILTSSGSLELLSHIQDPTDTRTQGLPSWVPDFSVPLGKLALTDYQSIAFHASGKRRQARVEIESDLVLLVDGCKIDNVDQVFRIDTQDAATSILRFGLAIPTPYPLVSSGLGLRATFEDFPILFSETHAKAIAEMQPHWADAKLYVAIGGSPVEVPFREAPNTDTEASASATETGPGKDVETGPPKQQETPPSSSSILWQTVTADGWRNHDDLVPEGDSNIRVTGESFSDWLLCSILDSYRLGTQTIEPMLSFPSPGSADSAGEQEARGIDAKKRYLSTRIRPKLDAWLDLSVGVAPGVSVASSFDHPNVAGTLDAASADISAWFGLYVGVAEELFRAYAAYPEMGLLWDEERRGLDPNLPGALELLAYQFELDSRSGKNKDKGNQGSNASGDLDNTRVDSSGRPRGLEAGSSGGDRTFSSMGDTKNLFDEAKRRRVTDFETRMGEGITGRCMLATKGGLVGLGPKSMSVELGDQIWLLRGASVPFVLRPAGDGRFRVVGEAFVYGIMRGEAVPLSADGFVTLSLV